MCNHCFASSVPWNCMNQIYQARNKANCETSVHLQEPGKHIGGLSLKLSDDGWDTGILFWAHSYGIILGEKALLVINYDWEVGTSRDRKSLLCNSVRVDGVAVAGRAEDSPGSRRSPRQCVIQGWRVENTLPDHDVIVLASSGLSFWHLNWTQCNSAAGKWHYLGWLRGVFELNTSVVVKKENSCHGQQAPEEPSLCHSCVFTWMCTINTFLYKHTDIEEMWSYTDLYY